MQPETDYTEVCGCGAALHYVDPQAEKQVRALVERYGPRIKLQVPGSRTAVLVPRHYIALHGLHARDLAYLADFYGWEKVLP